MTRQRRYDYEVIRREYIFDAGNPPISYTDLAEKHGMSRSLVSDRGTREDWAGQREAFRKALGIKTTEAMVDETTKFQIATRKRLTEVGLTYLDKYAAALDAGEIKVTTRDMLGVAAMVRTLIGDAASDRQPGEEGTISEDTPMRPEAIRLALLKLEAGDLDGDAEGHPAEEPAEAVGAD